jgi:hypothetical protein
MNWFLRCEGIGEDIVDQTCLKKLWENAIFLTSEKQVYGEIKQPNLN